jgi:hypothetical protein
MDKELVTIVIPLYKTDFEDFETLSLNRCLTVLSNYSICFVVPEKLDLTNLLETYHFKQVNVERFDPSYFKTVFGYNRLMLSEEFYSRFTNYKYMLIYQLDAFVFRDDLKMWCDKDYDYIGAPWLASPNSLIKKVSLKFKPKKEQERQEIFFKVGNGGFSLRKIAAFLEITKNFKAEIEDTLSKPDDEYKIMEDVFWSLKAKTLVPEFKIPDYKEAVSFAFDRKPKIAYKLNNNTLPFGCHGFQKKKVKEYWEGVFKNLKD